MIDGHPLAHPCLDTLPEIQILRCPYMIYIYIYIYIVYIYLFIIHITTQDGPCKLGSCQRIHHEGGVGGGPCAV